VTQGGTRQVFALIVAALAALLLVACGGSDSNSDSSSSNGSSTGEISTQGSGSQNQNGSQTQAGGRQGGGQSQNGSEGSQKQGNRGPKSYSAAEVSVPLKVSGGGSKQFIVKGGDNSIQEFGDEGDESELEAAARAVHDFYVARATGHWSQACDGMAPSLREQLEQLAAKSTQVKGCASFLEAFTSPLSASSWREINTIDAGSLRRENEQAFLIYTGAEGTAYAIPLKEEDGTWKVAALSATPLN